MATRNDPQRCTNLAQDRALDGGPMPLVKEAIPVSLCDDNHAALKVDEVTWSKAQFGGYQPLGRLLGEVRHCYVCRSTVVRLVPFTAALIDVIEELVRLQPPSEIYVHSASLLVSWALNNIPRSLGIEDDPTEPPTSPAAAVAVSDWRQFGIHLRMRRERAGLSRQMLSTLSGVADSTIRNFETGRHRPHGYTVCRLRAVPALQLGFDGNRAALGQRVYSRTSTPCE